MPPHCDSLDGPVVTAARRGLQQGDVSVVLPYVPANREQEVRQAFDLTVKARALGPGGARGRRPVALRDRRPGTPRR